MYLLPASDKSDTPQTRKHICRHSKAAILPPALYGFENPDVALRKEHGLGRFHSTVPRKTSGLTARKEHGLWQFHSTVPRKTSGLTARKEHGLWQFHSAVPRKTSGLTARKRNMEKIRNKELSELNSSKNLIRMIK